MASLAGMGPALPGVCSSQFDWAATKNQGGAVGPSAQLPPLSHHQ